MTPDILRRSYDRFAAQYDQAFGLIQRPKIEALLAALPSPLPPDIVDLGAGTCLLARRLDRAIVSLDISRGMLVHGAGPRVQAQLTALPFPDARFDLAFSVTALLDFVDPGPTLAEMARILRPGGWLALSVLNQDNCAHLEAALPHWFVEEARFPLGQDMGYLLRRPGH